MDYQGMKERQNPTKPMRSRVPPQITLVCPTYGPPIPVPPDRIIEVDGKNVKHLLVAGYRPVT
jgi:hypothetical protein